MRAMAPSRCPGPAVELQLLQASLLKVIRLGVFSSIKSRLFGPDHLGKRRPCTLVICLTAGCTREGGMPWHDAESRKSYVVRPISFVP